jgi:hypothetical protein
MSYNLGSPALKTLLENPYNFGGSPTAFPFRYRRSSDLYFRLGTYPPLPGIVESDDSMATNLGATPVYHTWDSGDTLPEALAQNPVMSSVITSLGGTYVQVTTSGTVDPNTLLPAPHSWAVLDEVELFDFFDGKTANRTPGTFAAQLDLPAGVSFADVTQDTANQFSYVDGLVDSGNDALVLVNVKNVDDLDIDLAAAGLTTTGPIDLVVESDDADGFTLRITGFAGRPAYLLDSASGTLLPGTESDPLTGSLIRAVAGLSTLDADVIQDPNWTTRLTTSPNPVAPGGALTMSVDAERTAVFSLLLMGFSEALNNIPGGNKVTVSLGPGTILIELPLDANGDVALPGTVPNIPAYSGVDVLLQTIDVDGGGQIDSISNMWVLHIQ